jgi:phosphonate transport system substrate-binding protein
VITRRAVVAAGLTALAAARAQAQAPSWRAAYPELTMAVIPAENSEGLTGRYGPFIAYLSRELGVPVRLRIANDYAAVIEGQRSGNVQIATYGPAAFARALITGVKTEAILIGVNSDGTKGYYSVFYVLKDSPYKSVADLKGRRLGLVDPNSTSGNNMPRFALDRLGIDTDSYFERVVFTGSHENAVLALVAGQVDVCANAWSNPQESTLAKMVQKGMIHGKDGRKLTQDDFRIILRSDLIINSPTAVLADLPAALKAAIRQAFLDAPEKDRDAFNRLSDGFRQPWQPIDNAAYDDTIKLIRFVDGLRKA